MTVRWAIVGVGRHVERNVIDQMKRAAGGAIVALHSRDRARGENFAHAHGVARVFTDFREIIDDSNIDAIYDASPDGLHADHAVAASAGRKHILLEKPLAISVAEGARALGARQRHGVTLGVVFNQRHETAHVEARAMIARDEIGETIYANVHIPLISSAPLPASAASWRADGKMRPGAIAISIGDHACDTLTFMVGQDIVEISAFTDATRDNPPNEHCAAMTFKMSGGANGHASTTSRAPYSRRPFEIHGTKGSIFIDNSFAYLTNSADIADTRLTLVNAAGERTLTYPRAECFRLEFEQFNRAIAGKGAPATSGAEALRSLAIGAAIYDSVKHGRVAKISDFLPA